LQAVLIKELACRLRLRKEAASQAFGQLWSRGNFPFMNQCSSSPVLMFSVFQRPRVQKLAI